jgi:hypothetical protein
MALLIDSLTTIVARCVADYNQVRHWQARGFYVEDPQQQLYMVVVVPESEHPRQVAVIEVMARVEDNKVIIDVDITDRPLYEALLRSGVPEEQIILRYVNEQVPPIEDEDDANED